MEHTGNFIFLSSLIKYSIVNSESGRKIGKARDLSASLSQAYPKVTGIIASIGKDRDIYIPWKKIKRISGEKKSILIQSIPQEEGVPENLSENEIRICETFYDRQIVDTAGMKVVRVNDLHFLKEDNNLWLVHIDVGTKGLLRRLGWLAFFNFLSRWLLSRNMKDKFIPWKFAQPVSTTNVHGALSLKIPSEGINQVHPADIADILEDLGHDERLILFNALGITESAKTLQELPIQIRTQIADDIEPGRFAKIIEEMDRDEVADLLAKLPQDKTDEVFDILPLKTVVELKELLSQSIFSAGSIMNTDFIALKKGLSAGQVLHRIRRDFIDTESIYYVYLVDPGNELAGVVTLRELLKAGRSVKVKDIMKETVVKAEINDKIKKVSQLFMKYKFSVLPVVDKNNILKGVITIKDALDSMIPEMKDEN